MAEALLYHYAGDRFSDVCEAIGIEPISVFAHGPVALATSHIWRRLAMVKGSLAMVRAATKESCQLPVAPQSSDVIQATRRPPPRSVCPRDGHDGCNINYV
jgi:hypothetical protein